MKMTSTPPVLKLSILILTGLLSQTASASSLYSGSADLNININRIINQSNPRAGYGNDIMYSGKTQLDSDSESIISGTGTVTPTASSSSLPSMPSILPENFSFNQSLQVEGNVSDGMIDSYYYYSWADLQELMFENTSSDTYQIDYTVSYNLSTMTGGDFSNATMSISGQNLGITDDYVEVNSDTVIANTDNASDSFTLSIILAAGDSLFFDPAIEFAGAAEASAAPVPVPAAIWMFMAGIMTLTGYKRKCSVDQL